jgi:hypothetical protein
MEAASTKSWLMIGAITKISKFDKLSSIASLEQFQWAPCSSHSVAVYVVHIDNAYWMANDNVQFNLNRFNLKRLCFKDARCSMYSPESKRKILKKWKK